jgi:hypothetical protein
MTASPITSPAVARIDGNTRHLSIDLANTLPEDGAYGEKYALGKVTLGVRQATPLGADPAANTAPIVCLGEIRNDRATFVERGGIYDLEVKSDAASSRRPDQRDRSHHRSVTASAL